MAPSCHTRKGHKAANRPTYIVKSPLQSCSSRAMDQCTYFRRSRRCCLKMYQLHMNKIKSKHGDFKFLVQCSITRVGYELRLPGATVHSLPFLKVFLSTSHLYIASDRKYKNKGKHVIFLNRKARCFILDSTRNYINLHKAESSLYLTIYTALHLSPGIQEHPITKVEE